MSTRITLSGIPIGALDTLFCSADYHLEAVIESHDGPRGVLRSPGLERYEAAFRENEIDESVLPNLTAKDLKDLGVGVVGHRRKLLDAIAALRTDSEAKALLRTPASAAPTNAASTFAPAPEPFGERRHVTVMFCDLVGSTAHGPRRPARGDLGLSEMRHRSRAAFRGLRGQVHGRWVLVYFGYTQAHEDDAERAVRAGLELVAAVTALRSRVLLKTRVGIATGLVVVGDLIGSGEAQERGIVGKTPNLRPDCKELRSRT
jgi:class 3 adenylate cyclase